MMAVTVQKLSRRANAFSAGRFGNTCFLFPPPVAATSDWESRHKSERLGRRTGFLIFGGRI
jgi:hypothetical protein